MKRSCWSWRLGSVVLLWLCGFQVSLGTQPAIRMLVPGFSARELPLQLTNINNLRYRSDGKLYALAYSGDIWLLSDTDGDQLEDRAELFFDNRGRLRGPIGMAVIPSGHALLKQDGGGDIEAAGVVVASKGQVSAILDINGDGVADVHRVIASGWKEIPQNVDAVGVAIDPSDGAIYFGLGTAAYNNAYLLDEDGQAHFDLSSDRGTIQRIAPDLSSRSTVCTGVRFTIGMAFTAHGQLFATDQEGATWLPNGNPFDELLHIQPGRHYGFPPRHPRHLPRVFDEPSLFDYRPQHQSTCGLVINEPLAPGGPIFGPDHWRGDALVTGQSRGKLYRTRLLRDSAGRYVAENHLIACLSMLAVDCCLSPHGDLLVACHSGGPDWGSGPGGIGKLFRIRHTEPRAAQPVSVWPAGPREVRVAFDHPLDARQLENLDRRTRIEFGRYVSAGDRFESLRPGYAVVQAQLAAPRFSLPVHAVAVTPDRRSLIFSTGRHRRGARYAITLPDFSSSADGEPPAEPRQREIDLAYGLTGVEARWEPDDQQAGGWSGWLPHPDLALCRRLLRENVHYDSLWQQLGQAGVLTIATRVDTSGLFLPAVQPGSELDFDATEDRYLNRRGLRFSAAQPFDISADGAGWQSAQAADAGRWVARVELADEHDSLPLRLRIKTGGGSPPRLRASWIATLADEKQRHGPLALHRFELPWGDREVEADDEDPADQAATRRSIPELAGGSWGRGRQVFHGDEAGCAKCHLADARGHSIGPDLANLVHRDYESVLRDIREPSFAINPDYLTYRVLLDDGRLLAGTLQHDGDQRLLGQPDGRVTRLDRGSIEQLLPSEVSIMPQGIDRELGPQRMKDLMAYLLREPPRMPRGGSLPEPPPRSRSEVKMLLRGADPRFDSADGPPPDMRPLNILLVAGPKDHGPGEHDYPAWLEVWSDLIAAAPGVTVDSAMEWPEAEQRRAADVIVFYQRGRWDEQRASAIDAHLQRGGGLVYIHWAIEGGPQAPDFARRIGLASDRAHTQYRHGPLQLHFAADSRHPIARNFESMRLHDESYWALRGDAARLTPIASAVEQGRARPQFWTVERDRGRVFVSIPGHYSWTFDDPLYRILLLRGIAWAAGEPVDRFNLLVTPGASLAD